MRGLVDRAPSGLVTTHDLALADIADSLGGRAANVHFEDHVENGQILRLPDAARRRPQEQCDRADALGRAGDLTGGEIRELARACGFELAGVARAEPVGRRAGIRNGSARGMPAEMGYLTDRRGRGPQRSAQSAAFGAFHHVRRQAVPDALAPLDAIQRRRARLDLALRLGRGLSRRDPREGWSGWMRGSGSAPARRSNGRSAWIPRRCWSGATRACAGLGWIGKNTCLISQQKGSWFFLGELLLSLELDADAPAAGPLRHVHALHRRVPDRRDRPGPPGPDDRFALCISYFTIELRGPIPAEQRAGIGAHRVRLRYLPGRVPVEQAGAVTADPEFARARSRRRWKSWRR